MLILLIVVALWLVLSLPFALITGQVIVRRDAQVPNRVSEDV